MSQSLPLDAAIEALKLDPTHPVRAKVDDELTVEVRAVSDEPARGKTVPAASTRDSAQHRDTGEIFSSSAGVRDLGAITDTVAEVAKVAASTSADFTNGTSL